MYLFKVNNRKTRKRYEICSKLKHRNDVIDVLLACLFLTLNIYFLPFSSLSIDDFEKVDVSWLGKVDQMVIIQSVTRLLKINFW